MKKLLSEFNSLMLPGVCLALMFTIMVGCQPMDRQDEDINPLITDIAIMETGEFVGQDTDIYTSIRYQIASKVPEGWSLSVSDDSGNRNGQDAPQVIELTKEGYQLLVYIRSVWNPAAPGGAMGPGVLVEDGTISLLGKLVPRNRLVFENRTKLVWYGDIFDDIELNIRIEKIDAQDWQNVDLPADLIAEVESWLSTFTRTGEPLGPLGDTESTPLIASSVEVDGWVGTLISTPEWPQIDDYFQVLDQDGARYGIHSLDATIEQRLVEFRDTGILIRIWGRLHYGRMDAFNTQIEVDRCELYAP